MPKIKYLDKKIGPARLQIIATANSIIAEYFAQGFQLTLRQLYYQFVARDFIANNQSEYTLLGDIINDGRLVGLIDWHAIVDRTRNVQSVAHWHSPSDIIESTAHSFRIDKWKGQPYRPEVWIEKDALVGVVEGICRRVDVPYFSCRGYTSQSEMWSGAMRLKSYVDGGQIPLILHFGDHDPSGKDMTRDITERLTLFMGQNVKVRRLALNWDQILKYKPPPNPTKTTDSRAAAYIKEFGHESWELDALEPAVIVELIRSTLESVLVRDIWEDKVDEERKHRQLLRQTSKQWGDVVKILRPTA